MSHVLKSAGPADQARKDLSAVRTPVSSIIEDIRARRDSAVREYSEKFPST